MAPTFRVGSARDRKVPLGPAPVISNLFQNPVSPVGVGRTPFHAESSGLWPYPKNGAVTWVTLSYSRGLARDAGTTALTRPQAKIYLLPARCRRSQPPERRHCRRQHSQDASTGRRPSRAVIPANAGIQISRPDKPKAHQAYSAYIKKRQRPYIFLYWATRVSHRIAESPHIPVVQRGIFSQIGACPADNPEETNPISKNNNGTSYARAGRAHIQFSGKA